MPDTDAEIEPLRRLLGDELRGVVDDLLSCRTPAGDLTEALDLVRAARARLRGPQGAPHPHRPDYWSAASAPSWDAYMDTTMFGGRVNPLGMPMPLELGRDDEGRAYAEGVVRLGRAYLGGPGMVHGGYVAALVDHVFGAALHAGDTRAVTATLQIRFVEPTPIGRDLRFRAWFEQPSGRRLHGRATCHDGDVCTAEAEGLFLLVDMGDMAARVART